MTAPEHVFDELPGMLAGELDRSTTGRVAAHLRTCDDCRQELVLVVSAGAALQSAMRYAPQVILESEEALPDPSGFLAELAAERSASGGQPGAAREAGPAGSGAETRPGPQTRPRPDTWPIPEARHEPETGWGEPDAPGEAGERPTARPGRRQSGHAGPPSWRRRLWAAAAAAVLVLAGIGAGVLINRDRTGQPPIHVQGTLEIPLQPVGRWTGTATATIQGDRMDIHPNNLALPKRGNFYEVWLAKSGPAPKVVSVGVLGPSGASLTVPRSLVSAYDRIVISYEPDDGIAAFSGDAVMSGQYA